MQLCATSELGMTSIPRHPSSFGGYLFSEEKKCEGGKLEADDTVLPSQSLERPKATALQNECQTATKS